MVDHFIHRLIQSTFAPIFVVLLAQAGNAVWPENWAPLINLGAIGFVLGWFLIRAEPRLGRIERAIDRSSRALLLAVLAMRGQDVHQAAKDLIGEIDSANNDRDR